MVSSMLVKCVQKLKLSDTWKWLGSRKIFPLYYTGCLMVKKPFIINLCVVSVTTKSDLLALMFHFLFFFSDFTSITSVVNNEESSDFIVVILFLSLMSKHSLLLTENWALYYQVKWRVCELTSEFVASWAAWLGFASQWTLYVRKPGAHRTACGQGRALIRLHRYAVFSWSWIAAGFLMAPFKQEDDKIMTCTMS